MNLSEHRPITKAELSEMISGMEAAERKGLFDSMFSGEQLIAAPGVSRELLIASINPDMKLTKVFFLKVYGYEISRPGFKEQALSVLEQSGCSKARGYYEKIVEEYQQRRDEEIQPVAGAYVKELNEKWEKRQKEGGRPRKQEIIQDLLQRNDKELLSLLQSMN